jgi:hypothetical protein
VFSIHQLAEPIVNLTNRESKLRFERLPSDNGGPDTSEAKLNLEWKWKSNTKLGGYLAKAMLTLKIFSEWVSQFARAH